MDTSYRREIEKAGLAFEQRYEDAMRYMEDMDKIFDLARMWVFVKDLNNHLIMVNRYYARQLGCNPEDVLGTPCESWFCKGDDFMEADRKLIETRRPVLGAIEHASTGRKDFTFRSDKWPLFDQKGEVYAILGIAVELPAAP